MADKARSPIGRVPRSRRAEGDARPAFDEAELGATRGRADARQRQLTALRRSLVHGIEARDERANFRAAANEEGGKD